MEVRDLDWFVVLAATENVTVAAHQLHISQPTLSRALARLERRAGVKLFDRHQNRLKLNRYGEIFGVHAARALRELEQAEELIRASIDPDSGSVSLGFLHSFGSWLIPSLIDAYQRSAPHTTFELEGGPADAITEGVRSGRIDMGFVAPRPAPHDLAWVTLGRERLVLEVPRGDEYEGREHVSMEELAARPMLALGAGFGLRQVVDDLFSAAGLSPQVAIEATELTTLRALVRHGRGVAIVPAPRGEASGASSFVGLSDQNAFREYGVVTRPGGPHGGAARAFHQYACSALADDEIDLADP